MSNIEKIVADYETCKKAWEIGLKLWDIEGNFNTVFAWWQCLHDYETNIAMQSEWDSEVKLFYHKMYPAPTAEEVPLPFEITFKIGGFKPSNCYRIRIYTDRICFGTTTYNSKYSFTNFYTHFPNKATAYLDTCIKLQNLPLLRQWYVDNNYVTKKEK